MELLALVAMVFILLTVSCYRLADKGWRKCIVIFNGVLYGIFIILLLLSFHQDMKIEKLSDKYKVHPSNWISSWTYEKSDNEYYYIQQSSLFGYDDYVVPRRNCKLSAISREVAGLILFTSQDTLIFDDNRIEIDGKEYILADSVVMIEPDYDYLSSVYTIIAGIILLIGNLITLIIVIVKKRIISKGDSPAKK